VRYGFIEAEKATFPIRLMCRVLHVTRSGYYRWRRAEESMRSHSDRALVVHVRSIHAASRGTYGSPRVWKQLRNQGMRCSKKRAARLMREAAIRGVKATFQKQTTRADKSKVAAPNLLDRAFEAQEPNQKWVADITYVRTREGWLYVAIILDLFSRRVVGHATSKRLATELVTRALTHALRSRRPARGLLHHSDRGSQYTSDAHLRLLQQSGVTVSMSRSGECHDNAVAESFFATLKTELIYRRRFATRAEATTDIFNYIELFYNTTRLHSTLGYLSPMQFERQHWADNGPKRKLAA